MIELVLIAALAQTETAIDEAPPLKDNGHLFLDFSGGANWYEDIANQDMGSGGFGSIGIGYEWGITDTGSVSVELEYSQHNGNTSDSFNVFAESGKGRGLNVEYYGDLSSHVFMLNGMWDQALFSDDHNGFGVYAGAGIGVSYNRGNLSYTVSRLYHHSKKSAKVYDTSTDFAWQIMGGIRWQFNENWRLYTGGRYADLGSIADPLDLDVESLVWEIGLRWSF
jgi:opacity protein-like surface antigen